MKQRDIRKNKGQKGGASYYIPNTMNNFPNCVQPYSPSLFDSVSSGHGVISQGTGHGNAGRGFAKYGGGKGNRKDKVQYGGSNPSLNPNFPPAVTDMNSNISYFDCSSGVSGFHPGFFDGVYSGHGTSSFSSAHSTAGLGLGKYDQIGYGSPSLWDFLNLDPEGVKSLNRGDETVVFSNLYWFPGPTFAMFEVEYSKGGKTWVGDGIIVDEFGSKIVRGRLMSCDGNSLSTISLSKVLMRFFTTIG